MLRTSLAGWPLALLAVASHAAPDTGEAAAQQRGFAALRAMDCARCHGRDFAGLSAPSLLAAVREGSRERFDWYVLKGDIGRGMPGYESQPLVVAQIDAMYAWLIFAARQRTFTRLEGTP